MNQDWHPLPMDEGTLANSSYIVRHPCGCFAGCITLPDHPRQGGKYNADDRKTLMDWIKDGCIIDRVPDQWIRDNGFQRCEAHASPPEQQRMEL